MGQLVVMSGAGKQPKMTLPEGHPIHTLMEEHAILLDFAAKLEVLAGNMGKAKGEGTVERLLENLDHIVDHFKESEKHYIREENVLFPHLERRGITGPPAQMWNEHNEIREIKKRLYRLAGQERPKDLSGFNKELAEVSSRLSERLQSHFNKENNMLFPMALQVMGAGEWVRVGQGFDEIGYCCFTPVTARGPEREENGPEQVPEALEGCGELALETGSFSIEQLETVLDTLPVDMTFVDANDEVRYYSNSKDRIFPRTTAIIGRKVQNCHPQKSIGAVQRILDEFRQGKRDTAEFWFSMGERMVHIRYFALRRGGKYLGTLEVSQDIAPLRNLQGEKKLQD